MSPLRSAYVKEHADTPEKQAQVLDTLRFKCDVLWVQLDALYFAYVEPGLIPPGAFVPEQTGHDATARSRAAPCCALPPHAKFRFDEVRQAWIVLAPERLLLPDEQAVAVLQLVDGAARRRRDHRRAERRNTRRRAR